MTNQYYNNILKNKYTDYTVKNEMNLLQFLISCVTGGSRTKAKKLLSMKMVFVDKVITTQFDTPLKTGQLVQIAQRGNPHELKSKYVNLIYEDAFIIVVEKQSGIVSVPMPGTKELSVKSILNEYVKRRNRTASVHTVHRLDRGTSGIMMFAKNREIQQILIDNWHQIIKERKYVAVVEGKFDNKMGTVTSWLSDDKRYVIFSSPVVNSGKYAVTHYKTLKTNNMYSLMELKLETGRTNQIRVHMKELKHPVVGDEKYGYKTSAVNRLCLHAKNLCFYHPVTNEFLNFDSMLPKCFNDLMK